MYKLRRLYLDSIGVDDNRFTDVMVAFTDTDGSPTDSIIWLRNGAGKTTMMSLLLALIRPERREFLSYKLQGRTLTDLVQGGDTSHVVAEWVGPAGQLLLTGAIYEWDGRQRPADYNTNGYKRFSQTWWCLTPEEGVEGATLDSLPFTYRSRGTYDREKFTSHLTSLRVEHNVDVRIAPVIKQWHEALRERNFDPDLFTYFVEVNSAEGGMKNLFKGIDSAGAFVNYLLRFVADPNQIRPVHNLLQVNAAELVKRPMYEAEKAFCDEAKIKVAALGAAYSDQQAARQTLEHERGRAARFKTGLLSEAEIADESTRIAESLVSRFEDELKPTRSELDMRQVRAAFYRMKSAEFAEADAEAELTDAQTHAQETRVTREAWSALEHWLELQTRQQTHRILEQSLAAKKEGAKPLQERLELAQAELAGALQNAETQSRKEAGEIAAKIKSLQDKEQALTKALSELAGQIARLESEEEQIRATQAQFDATEQDLLSRGVIGPDEDLAAAAARIAEQGTQAVAALERIAVDVDSVSQRIAAADKEKNRLVGVVAAAAAHHSTLFEQLQTLGAAAAALGSTPRLRMLMQADSIDLGVEIADAILAVERAHADESKKLLEVNEAIAAGERALSSLKSEGLLPPRLQVQKIVDELTAAGITAVPGWRYLATNKKPEDHAAIIAALPAVVDGVIVYTDDPSQAAAHIGGPVDEAVVIAPATVFEYDHPEPYLVLGPAPAQHDKAAAGKELAARSETHDGLQRERENLTAQRNSDEALLSKLRVLQQSFPDGGLRTLELQVTDAERRRDAAEGDLEKAATGKEDLDKELGRLQGEQREQERRKDFSDQVGPQVRELARQEEEVIFPNIARLERIPEERSTLQARRVRDDKAAEEARNTRVQLAIDEKEKLRLGNDLRKQLQILPAPRPTELPLEVARAAATQAEQQLRDKFPEDALLASINAAKQEAERVAESWHNFAENVRVRANELAATSAAGDRADRAEAAARAENDYSAAQRAVGEVGKALESAQSKRAAEANTFKAKALKGRREFEREDPADADHADRLAAEDDQAAADLEAKRWKLERDQKLARDDAARHKFRAQLLRDQAVRIRTDPLEMLGDIAVVIPQVDDEVRAAVTAIDSDLEVAENLFEEAAANFDAVCDQIVAWAGSDRFARVADDENGEFVRKMREMLRDKDTLHQHRVASEADTVVADLTVRSPRIVDQIAQAEATKANVAAKLSDLVADALDSLARASKLSEFPDGVGAWDGKRFIEVAPKATPTHEQISVRVGTLIDTMVHGKVEQNPVQLLWMATEASVPEGFKARILKPTPEQSSARLDVSEMQKWSGGENLTASVILYCVLARMRAEKRSGEKTAALGGVLPMDNPIGTANLRDFLLLHRKVARANGVQLAYWTALGDLGAITVFPRIVAMRKRPSQRRSGRFYVDVGEEIVDTAASPGQELESVASVRRES